MGLQLLSGPAAEPVTLSEVKAFARIDTSADDTLLTGLIAGMRALFERSTALALIHQTWKLTLNDWPAWSLAGRGVSLPLRPVTSIVSLVIDAGAASEVTVPPTDYVLDSASYPPRLVEEQGAAWPSPQRPAGGISLSFQTGFGANGDDVPADIRTVLLRMISEAYEHRGETGAPELVPGLAALLQPYREPRL